MLCKQGNYALQVTFPKSRRRAPASGEAPLGQSAFLRKCSPLVGKREGCGGGGEEERRQMRRDENGRDKSTRLPK